MSTVEFARGGMAKAAPKAGKAAKPGIVDAVVGAITGGGGAMNGTVNGKRGFQPGNTYGTRHGGKGGSPAVKAAGKHRSARAVVSKHVKAGTVNTPEGRAAVRVAASAHRELQAARSATASARSATQKADRAVASGRASSLASKPGETTTKPATKDVGAHAARDEYLADAASRKAAFLDAYKAGKTGHRAVLPDLRDAPAEKPTIKARVEKSAKEASGVKVDMAATHLGDLHAGAKAGALKPTDIHAHVERVARGTTKDELFAAAKKAGIEHKATTKKALVEHIKEHAHGLSKPAEPAKVAPAAAAKPAPTKAEAPKPTPAAPAKAPEAKAAAPKPAEKAPAKAEAPKAAEGVHPQRQVMAKIEDAFHKHDVKGENNVTIDKLRAELPDVPRHEFDAAFRQHQVEKRFTIDSHEGLLRPPTQAMKDAAILHPARGEGERPTMLIHVSKRDGATPTIAPPAAPAPKAGPAPRAAEKSPSASATAPHAARFKDALAKVHGGEIDDRRTTVAEVARKSGMDHHEVEATVKELGAKGALSFDHATPSDVAAAKGFHTFPTDHEGKPYHGFRVDRPRKFHEATKGGHS